MPDDETFEDAMQSQCALMTTEARRIMERGYAVTMVGFNRDADNNHHLFNYIGGGFAEFAKQWNETYKHNYIVVTIAAMAKTTAPSGFIATFRVPTLKRFAPLVVALDLVSVQVERRYQGRARTKNFTYLRLTDIYEYKMYDKESLKIALSILDMPQHRELLTKRGRR